MQRRENMIHLYIKTHNTTGLKYFGKTTRDPYSYSGSGKYWKKHLKKHGDNVTTEIVGSFPSKEECESFALQFSIENNIIESGQWANLINENGLDGAPKGNVLNNSIKQKISDSLKGKPNPKTKYIMKESSETRSKRCKNIAKDTFWINNGIENKRSKILIDGWKLGRIQNGKIGDKSLGSRNNGSNTKGRKIYNDGKKHAYYLEGQQPEGWVRGKMQGYQGGTGTNKKGKKYGKQNTQRLDIDG